MDYNNLKRIAPIIQQEIDNGAIVGSSICIIKDEKEIYRNNFGMSNRETNMPMKSDNIFRLFSMTKPVTAVAAMILFERGELDLFSPVSMYLEGFKNQKVVTENGFEDVKNDVTIKDLLNMTSGVVYPDLSFEAGRIMADLYSEVETNLNHGKPTNTIDFANLIGKQPLEFQPGQRWRYSASADVLGAVIEVISGKKFSVFLEDEIFAPLLMVDTGFYVPDDKKVRFAEFYDYIPEKGRLEVCTTNHLGLNNFLTPPAFESGGAGLVSTIDDYKNFALMLLNHGTYNGVRILGRKTVDYLTKNQLTKDQAISYDWDSIVGYGYGNLMRVLNDQGKAASNGSLGEYGWDGWTGTYFFIDPVENLVLLYMIQKCGGGNPHLIRAIRSIVYSTLD